VCLYASLRVIRCNSHSLHLERVGRKRPEQEKKISVEFREPFILG
jgi:hypothetical protein